MKDTLPMTRTPNNTAYDNDFLKNWLENRYGCGFAQMVVDDVCDNDARCHAAERLEDEASFMAANDNMANDQTKHSA